MVVRVLRWSSVAAAAVLLIATFPAQAHVHPASSNCNTPCTIKADKPIDLQLHGCSGGELSMATYANKALNQGGTFACSTADFWTILLNGQTYTNSELVSTAKTVKAEDGLGFLQSFHLTAGGADIVLQANYTLVKNGTLIRYNVHNHDDEPADIGFKYSWDLQVDNQNDAKIYVDNRPGDGDGPARTYGEHDVNLGPPSNDIEFIKVWQTRNGPDGEDDVKQYFWFSEDWGGTPPDLVQYMASSRASEQRESFTYQPSTALIQGDSEMQTYFGKPDLIHLEPDDGVDDLGADEKEYVMWMGTGIPDPLISYRLAANFPARGPEATFTQAFVKAGEKAQYLVRVASLTGLGNGKSINQRFHVEAVAQALPPGWTVQLLDDGTGQPAQDVMLPTNGEAYFRLLVGAPKDAYGKDVARVVVRASLADLPNGLYNKKHSVFEIPLTTTTIVSPQYGLGLDGPDDVLLLPAGDSIEVPVRVTNQGNLRDPFGVEMDWSGGCSTLAKEIAPQVFSLARGQTQEVKVKVTAPAEALSGEQSCTLRATEPESQQSNKTTLRVRIASDSDIQIVAEQEEILLPPGSEATFRATVYNIGFDEVDLDLHGSANQVCSVIVGTTGCEYAEDAWSVDVDVQGTAVRLAPGASQKVSVTVRSPTDAKSGEQRAVLLSASKAGSTATVAEELVRAIVERVSVLSAVPAIESQTSDPGRTLGYAVKVRNDGNSVENLTLEMAKLPAGWAASIVPDRFELGDGQERTVSVTVTSTASAAAGLYDLEVLARNADQRHSATAALKTRINQVFGALVGTETPVVRILPTDRADVVFEVTNTGNGPDAFALSGIPTTWDVTLEPSITPQLEPGKSALVRLRGTLGGALGSQTVPLVPVSVTSGDATGSEPLPFTLIVSRPDLYVRSVKVLSPAAHVGDVEVITAEIENLGGIEAKDVRVALFVDGQPTGTSMDFERLAPDRVLVASLPWTSTGGEHTYRVEVDPDGHIDEGEAEGNNVAVLRSAGAAAKEVHLLGAEGKLAGRFSPGATLPLLLMAFVAALALALRRRPQ